MDEHVNAQMQHFTLVPELLARTNYVSTLPVRLAGRYRARLEIFELPFEARGCVTRWLGSRQVKGQR
jgi:hypothetical protein